MSFSESLDSRILVLDGAMGTMIQRKGYYLENNESLNLSNPELIASIHDEYIRAGADIITTNSFGANVITQSRHGREGDADLMAFNAARIARNAADKADRKVYVAASVGPTGYSLSLPADAADPSYRKFDFEAMYRSYLRQMKSLTEGGADLILIETCFDSLNVKAAIYALEELGCGLPSIISASISDRSFRLLTGQTLEAFYHSVKHCPNLAAFGINCSLGSAAMAPVVREISSFSPLPLIFYPNAGMPDENGLYNETPEYFADEIKILAEEGHLNITGGCCGTGPEHIRAVKAAVEGLAPEIRNKCEEGLTVSGLESVHIDKAHNFTNIGERTNVAGSKKFSKLIASSDYAAAMKVARDQVQGGATVIDVNMDDPLVNSGEKMREFLRFSASDPEIAKCAIMIDSSDWDTVIEGLRNSPGKSIVNSISLRDGEEVFKRNALEIRRYGAAMVVMAFDEQGQAVTYDRKAEICRRSYEILTGIGIKPQDIIFDCNVLTIGTGIREHAEFGNAFLKAVSYIKHNLPGALTSGGISNLSFAFRGNNPVREAMHSVFLYHAIRSGLDMAIVNPQMLEIYDSINPDLRKCVEDVILNTDEGACERLSAKAAEIASEADCTDEKKSETASADRTPEEALSDMLLSGDTSGLEPVLKELLTEGHTALSLVEGPLMNGMEKVGRLFEAGRMFLPQVVRSARVMHEAVGILRSYMKSEDSSGSKPRFLIATVQGDVHDIGKNITSTVLQCSGFEVIDLGVMVPVSEILAKAQECCADIIGVSGLITPSLAKMQDLCKEMKRRNLSTPLFVGGAATSELHTAVKLSPYYDNVFYGSNASETAVSAKKCIFSFSEFKKESAGRRKKILEMYNNRSVPSKENVALEKPVSGGNVNLELEAFPLCTLNAKELAPDFDWKLFNAVCGSPSAADEYRQQACEIIDSDRIKVKLVSRFFKAFRKGESLEMEADGRMLRIPMLRDEITRNSLLDYFEVGKTSDIGIFAVTVTDEQVSESYDLLRHAVKSTLAEAGSEYLRKQVLKQIKGPEAHKMKLIAPGIGYPCCPDHGLKREILGLLPNELGIELTESCAMIPEHSTCGFLILHPDAEYRDIRQVSGSRIMEYAAERGYDEDEKNLFLGFLEKQI